MPACDCDQSFEVHPPGYHSLECSIWGPPYVLNFLSYAGRRIPVPMQTTNGMLLFPERVDTRDGFEMMPTAEMSTAELIFPQG